ncbi:MAG: acyl-[acyl-carrier-protein]--UDP-N-acetylglucosamine O-acyltransferase, partial [Paracoccaceae bacterium]|nr:acyl-[acyl-carrier-protein]--UDP-N-acetylglucosamine O-acyltransferase [Paracoccaceae bacterium]
MGVDPSARIHPSAVVEAGASIGPGCVIGPFSIVGPEVTLGPGVELKSHAVVTGWTEVGEGTVIWPFACVGEVPQDLKFKGERTRLVVGKRNRIREGATLNTGTEGGGGVTRIGDDNLLMTGAHVGHDAQLGSRIVLANQVAISGHCLIEDDVIIG